MKYTKKHRSILSRKKLKWSKQSKHRCNKMMEKKARMAKMTGSLRLAKKK